MIMQGVTWQNALGLAAFVALCGFIAYWGDLLGRRMGKRRLSLFGMRPRYTAIVTTTITGMLIAIFSIGAMAVVSQRVRLLLLQGYQIISERKEKEQQLIEAREKLDKASQELEHQQLVASRARKEARTAVQQRDALSADITKLSANLSNLKASLQKNEAALALAEKHLKSARGDLSSAKLEIADRRKELAKRNKEIEDRKREIEQQKKAIANLESLKATLSEALALAQKHLQTTEKDLASAKQEIENRRQEIEKQNRMIQEFEARRARLAEEFGAALESYPRYIALRERPIIFRSNDEIVRRVIQRSQPKSTIRREVMALLDEADKYAGEKGASVEEGNRTIDLLRIKFVTDTPESGKFVDESESIDAVVDNISGDSGSVVLRVVSVSNSFEGEQALVDFRLNYNRLEYKAGEEVASTIIDGRQSRGAIFGRLVRFFRTDVRTAAIERGIIPTFDEEGQPTVGQVPGDEIFDLVDRIKSGGRSVRVRALAAKNTWSAGPLLLDLEVTASL